jgi:hypothetical protein
MGLALESLRRRLELLCTELADGEVRDIAEGLGVAPALDRVVAAVRDDLPWDDAAVAADLDELDDAFSGWEVDGLTKQHRSFETLPGTSIHPVIDVWMCPAERCTRVVPAMRDVPGPICTIMQTRCRLRRLPT